MVVGKFKMKPVHLRIALSAAALCALATPPALAQRPLSQEQQIMFLQQQLSASQAAAVRLEQRLNQIERQLQQLINLGEVNGHAVQVLQSDLGKLRSDFESRIAALESRPPSQQSARTVPEEAAPAAREPAPQTAVRSARDDSAAVPEPARTASSDAGEEAYSEGFRLWRDGEYDRAITALRAFLSGYPDHRRASFARNLIGRAMLDKGQPRPAAEALLANYRTDPKGERAPDSLYYLGQALMKLDQPGQACKAYGELEDIYGSSIRPDLQALVSKAKADARCS
ncbi:MAG TPA: tetratricopeptide repeat protein [Sphingomicrobium sp.]|nr:tetratricopeptide repeat protein [Sphingomicrobium sp.]